MALTPFPDPLNSPVVCTDWRTNKAKTVNYCRDFYVYELTETVDSSSSGDWLKEYAITVDDANALTIAICSLLVIAYVGGLIGRSMLQI